MYTTKVLTPDYRIHWRILKEQKEIEMIMVVNGTSWVALGWRPRKLTAECRKFPLLQDIGTAAEPASEPEPSSKPEPEPSSTEPNASTAEPEPSSAEPTTKPEPASSAEPSASAAEPKSEPTSEPSSEPISKAEPLAQKSPKDAAASGSSKTKRVASPDIPSSKDEYTVSTSVTYKVSTVTGRRKRAVEKGRNYLIVLIKETKHREHKQSINIRTILYN